MENIQEIKISKLEVNKGQVEGLPKNPRFIRDERYKALCKSIEDAPEMLKLRELMVVEHGSKFVVIGGNMRLRACKELGMETVPCKVLPADTPVAKLREYAIKDNNGFGEDDWDVLANEWDAEELQDWGMELPMDWDVDGQGDVTATEDDFDESEVTEAVCKRGEVWKLGEHRLMCGDSTNADDVARLMDGELADMVFTDPPYGMNLDTDYSSMQGFGQGGKYEAGHVDDFTPDMVQAVLDLNAEETFIWGCDYFAEFIPNRNNGSFIVWDKRANESGTIEQDESSDKMFGSCFELCWSKTKHKRDIARIKWAGMFGMNQTTDAKRVHPTQKPIALVAWFLNRYGKDSDIVADLFGGSGSTLIACEQLNRKCRMMELDPHYCDVIIARWEKLTGQKAERISDG